MQSKKIKIQFLNEHTTSLNHWRDELLKLDKTYFHKDPEKERTIKNMLNKYLDDVLEYNKKSKEKPKKKV
jgi:hypothetical protein